MIRVQVAKGPDAYRNTLSVLEGLDLPDLKGRRVLLKPNASRLLPPEAGATTHPAALAAAIDFFQSRRAAVVAVGESPVLGVKTPEAFEITGLAQAARSRGIPLLDFDARPARVVSVPGGRVVKKLKVAAALAEHDFLVSLPVMKTHMHTGVTLSLKNLKGLLWRRQKVAFHQLKNPLAQEMGVKELDLAIADLAGVIHPDLALIDGAVGMEGLGPGAGEPKNAGLTVASLDSLAADFVAARLMGLEPRQINHLRLIAQDRGFSESDIQVSPAHWPDWITPFARPPERLDLRFPGLTVLSGDSCSACQSSVFIFLKSYFGRLNPPRPLHLALGLNPPPGPEDTLHVGNCACAGKTLPPKAKIPGCPPVASQIWEKLIEE